MPSTRSGRGDRGSKRCLQDLVNDQPDWLANLIICHSPSLSTFAPESFRWKSPLEHEDYLEYRDDFLRPLEYETHEEAWKAFWPTGGPQWDALAVASNGEGAKAAIVVEAKSYPAEAKTDTQAGDASLARIEQSLKRVIDYCGAEPRDVRSWTHGYYQAANRLATLFFLSQIARVPAWLVLLNFVNDRSHQPTQLRDWRLHQVEMFQHLGLKPDSLLLSRVITVCIDPTSCRDLPP